MKIILTDGSDLDQTLAELRCSQAKDNRRTDSSMKALAEMDVRISMLEAQIDSNISKLKDQLSELKDGLIKVQSQQLQVNQTGWDKLIAFLRSVKPFSRLKVTEVNIDETNHSPEN